MLYSSTLSDKRFSKAVTSFIFLNGKDCCIFDVSVTDALDFCWLFCFSIFVKWTFRSCIPNVTVVIAVYIFLKWPEKLIVLSKQCQK